MSEKSDALKRKCTICGKRGISVRRFITDSVRCDACGQCYKRVGSWGFIRDFLLYDLGLCVLLLLVFAAMALSLPWAFAIGLAILAGWVAIDHIMPLRPVAMPIEVSCSRRHRLLQYFLIAMPFLQWLLPFIGQADNRLNRPVAISLAVIAGAVMVYCAALNGQYFFFRGLQRARKAAAGSLSLAKGSFVYTFVIPALLSWVSLGIFYFQIEGEGASLLTFGLGSIAVMLFLSLSMLICYQAGTRRKPSGLAFG